MAVIFRFLDGSALKTIQRLISAQPRLVHRSLVTCNL